MRFLAISALVVCTLSAGALTVERMHCEDRDNPVGIDTWHPRLGWTLASGARGDRQTAYRILVASSKQVLDEDRGDLWDSGKVESPESTFVAYGGPMRSRLACFWKVQVWDAEGKPSAWSAPASFEFGLLDGGMIESGDWRRARWIERTAKVDDTPQLAEAWLWHPEARGEGARVWFRREVELENGDELVLDVTVDDGYTLFLNGQRVGEGGSWKQLDRYRWATGSILKPGKNGIVVVAHNGKSSCGMLAGLAVKHDGKYRKLPVEGWRASDSQDGESVPPVRLAAVGEAPWGEIEPAGEGPRRSVMMRREFLLPSEPARARVYVSGLGFYELHLNGKRVGQDCFTPGWTHYPKRVQYQTYDVTPLLKKGKNAAGAILGNGWWSGGLGWGNGQRYARPGEQLRLLMLLEVECADGSKHLLTTDGGGWTAHDSPITEDTLYGGEHYDARLEAPGWDGPGFDDKDWTPVEALSSAPIERVAQVAPTLRVTQQLTAKNITEPSPGVFVFDFAQNHSGFCRLKVNAPAGTRLQIRHAETLEPDGTLYTANYRSAEARDIYICKGGGEEVWQPRFTYRGFRYAELTGYPGKPTQETLVSQVMYSALPDVGTFECGDPLLNALWGNVVWGLRSNLHSVPTDCPQRDERLGWMGDAQAIAPTMFWAMDALPFFTKWTRDIRDSQKENGASVDVAPRIVADGDGAPGWGDAIAIVPWVSYLYSGDRRMLDDNYDAVKRWVEYMRAHSEDDLYERAGYGDWVPVVASPREPIGSAYYFYSTSILVKMAKILGKEDDAREYGDLARRIADAYNKKHFNTETKQYSTGTQTMNLLPLVFGITPASEREAVEKSIIADVVEHDGLTTGFLGSSLLLPTLSRAGRTDLAWKIASATTYPSLGWMRENGATTIWERWNSHVRQPGMNSHNHFAFGSQAEWYWTTLAGIVPDPGRPGFAHFTVAPQPVGDLTWARAKYNSIRGPIESAWKIESGVFTLDVTVPVNAEATVVVPYAGEVEEGDQPLGEAKDISDIRKSGNQTECNVGSGRYQFTVKLP